MTPPKGCVKQVSAKTFYKEHCDPGDYVVFWDASTVHFTVVWLAGSNSIANKKVRTILWRTHNLAFNPSSTPFFVFKNYFFARAFYHHGDPFKFSEEKEAA